MFTLEDGHIVGACAIGFGLIGALGMEKVEKLVKKAGRPYLHGEARKAFPELRKVYKVFGSGEKRLEVIIWEVNDRDHKTPLKIAEIVEDLTKNQKPVRIIKD